MASEIVYDIARLKIGLRGPAAFSVPEAFVPFQSEGPADVICTLHQVPELAVPEGKPVFEDHDFAVYSSDHGFQRIYFESSPRGLQPYASFAYDWQSGRGTICTTPEKSSAFTDSMFFFSHMGFESILMSRHRLALHASLIETEQGGLLFSGVSGIGKSTQADLWHTWEGSRIINGDRPILGKRNGIWEASGSPFAGSSMYYVNQSVPIRAIVLLEQRPDCVLQRLPAMEAFRGLYAGITLNDWNRAYVLRACDLLEDLSRQVPVYHYGCTPDARAVRTLKTALETEET